MLDTRSMIAMLVGWTLFGCATTRVQTGASYDPSMDFGVYRTFALAPPPTSVDGIPGYSEITGRQVQERISMNLEQKGLRPATWGEADLQVSFTLGGQPRQETEYWGGWGWYGPGEVTTENYVHGSLVIDMADRVRQRLVWHGYGSEDVFSQAADDEAVMKAVAAVLEKFPPGGGTHSPPEAPKMKADDLRESETAE